MEFVADESDLVGGLALIGSVGPGADECEVVGTASAFGNDVVGLGGADVTSDFGTLLLEVEVTAADGAVGERITNDPVAGKVGGEGDR